MRAVCVFTTFPFWESASNVFKILSSSDTCTETALLAFEYPSAAATSFPTNHGSPSFSIHLRSPNSGLLKSSHWEAEEVEEEVVAGVIVVNS